MKARPHLRVACIQMNAGPNWRKNLHQAKNLLRRAARAGAHVALLPENFSLRAAEADANQWAPASYREIISELSRSARENRITIVGGSFLEPLNLRRADRKPKFANTCFVFSPSGKIISRYRKMHLFDIDLPGLSMHESKTIMPGKKPGLFRLGATRAGVGICYDLRFPEYFRCLSRRGAEVLFLPANFTAETGKTAWEVLLRARAIENQCFVVAAGQSGRHPGTGILSYGHSLIIDPQGRIMKQAGQSGTALLIADLNLADLRLFRRRFPVLKHRKIKP